MKNIWDANEEYLRCEWRIFEMQMKNIWDACLLEPDGSVTLYSQESAARRKIDRPGRPLLFSVPFINKQIYKHILIINQLSDWLPRNKFLRVLMQSLCGLNFTKYIWIFPTSFYLMLVQKWFCKAMYLDHTSCTDSKSETDDTRAMWERRRVEIFILWPATNSYWDQLLY